jgi:hypothetical protein
MNYFRMPAVTLSTGLSLLSEHVQMAAYQPRGSIRVEGLVNMLLSGPDAVLTRNEQDFLYVRTKDGAVRVRGSGAAEDATALEEAGVYVYRSFTP